eukprot:396915-Pyramimonas_sp.AAC.1
MGNEKNVFFELLPSRVRKLFSFAQRRSRAELYRLQAVTWLTVYRRIPVLFALRVFDLDASKFRCAGELVGKKNTS